MKTIRTFDLESRLIEYADACILFIESQPSRLATRILGNQLLRSCTSPALNYGEVQSSESDRDFIHKMKICLKELRESHITLRILAKRKYVDQTSVLSLMQETDELIRIFVVSIKTACKNNP